MRETAPQSVGPDSEGADSEKGPLFADEAPDPDFFDHWMEEYASRVEEDQRANVP